MDLNFMKEKFTHARSIQVVLVPTSELSSEDNKRFSQLFSIKPKWRLEDIEPYLEPLMTRPGAVKEKILKRGCRTFVENGVRFVCRR